MKQLLLSLFILGFISAKAQDKIFPDDFLGVYKGDLEITNAKGKQSVGMEFHLTATDLVDVYNYVLVYMINGEPSPRNYTLKVKDKSKGEFVIDENNGIILNAKLVDNTLYSVFEVSENLLITTERFFDDKMEFEIIFSGKDAKLVNEGNEETPMVTSYPVTVTQKAILIKQ
ncbi:hypothetical protein [Olleya sp. R77988]|uniref:hypothetical protein n=1 Tax=Olleya sp. R77988 TaxID=3093875 RepID=UPI0037C7B2D2